MEGALQAGERAAAEAAALLSNEDSLPAAASDQLRAMAARVDASLCAHVAATETAARQYRDRSRRRARLWCMGINAAVAAVAATAAAMWWLI
jgi:hypothetical protein